MASYLTELDFKKSTLDPSFFQLEDVARDNACFYRALANMVHFSCPTENLTELKSFRNYGHHKELRKVYQHPLWGYEGRHQSILAVYLHEKIYNWIIHNLDTYISECQMTMENILQSVHNVSGEEYVCLYSSFPTCNDSILTWGGLPEQIAFTRLFQVPLHIFTAVSYRVSTQRLRSGRISAKNRPEKNVRFQLLQKIGEELKTDKPPLKLLWKKFHSHGHYMALYTKLQKAI